jgi:hypothetical protein
VRGPLRLAMALSPPRRFVRDRQGLDDALAQAKQISCPHCHRTGMIVGHGLLMGYAERSSDREVRGRRLLCSGRLRRSGCGRTFSVLISTMMAGFAVRTRSLSGLLEAVVGGCCLKAAWEKVGTGLSLRSGYRLWARLMAAQSHVRTMLCAVGPPPASTDARPVAQMLAHLRQVLGSSECVLGSLQFALQRGVFD